VRVTVQELEKAIARLSPEEMAELRAWFWERDQEEWDRRIARDSEAGKLDKPIARAKRDYAAGSCEAFRGREFLAMLRRAAASAAAGGGQMFRAASRESEASFAAIQENWRGVVRPGWPALTRAGDRRGRWLFPVLDRHAR